MDNEIAKALADEVGRACGTLEKNMLAVTASQLLAAGKSKKELESMCQFLQLLTMLLKNYM